MSSVMFENILKELSNLVSENDLHVSQVSHHICKSIFCFFSLYEAFLGIEKVLCLSVA